jgi:hypothetical protein
VEHEGSIPYSQEPFTGPYHPGPRPLEIFHNKLIFYGEELLAPRPTSKLEDYPLSAVRSYPPYLEAVSSIRNRRTRHVVVTRDPHNMIPNLYFSEMNLSVMDRPYLSRVARQRICKRILEVPQSAVRPRLLSSQRFGNHVFVTTDNLHGYGQATEEFHGYELAYIRSHADSSWRIRQTDVLQGSSVCEH